MPDDQPQAGPSLYYMADGAYPVDWGGVKETASGVAAFASDRPANVGWALPTDRPFIVAVRPVVDANSWWAVPTLPGYAVDGIHPVDWGGIEETASDGAAFGE